MLCIKVPADGEDNGNFRYEVAAAHPIVATVGAAVPFQVQTLDSYSGRDVHSDDLLDPSFFSRVLPVTGPIAIEGVRAGEWLAVHVRAIQTWDHGTMILRQGKGLLGRQRIAPPTAYRFEVTSTHASHPVLGTFPTTPMVGTIWLAPKEGSHWPGLVGEHSGNLDCPEFGLGATIVMPVAVPGARLYVGDGHAIMGHGELGSTGIEIGLNLELAAFPVAGPDDNASSRVPLLRARDGWLAAIGQGDTLDAAAMHALSGLQGWLAYWDCDEVDARIAVQGEARICQIVNNRYTVTIGLYPHPALEERVIDWLHPACA